MSSHRTRKRDIFKWSRHGAKDTATGVCPNNNEQSSLNVERAEVLGPSPSLRSKDGTENSTVFAFTVDPPSLRLSGFWKEAYEKLEAENPKIIQAYKKGIARFSANNDEPPQNTNSDMPLEEVVKRRLQEIQDTRLKFVVAGREIVVREQVSRAIHMLTSVKDLISTAISSEPHASLAWAGVLILLDPIAKSTTQDDDAMDGLEKISHLMIRYRILESTPVTVSAGKGTTPLEELEASIKSQIVHLYTEILKYQMQLASHLSKSGLFRFFEDLTGSEDWKGMTQGMKDIDEGIHNSLRSLSAHSLKSVQVQVEKIDRGVDELMQTMKETKEELTETRHTQLLSSLNIAEGAMFNSFQDRHRTQCLQGTQTNPLKQVQAWCENPRSKQIYWLAGMPGTGKSTIARTLASACHDRAPILDEECLRENIVLAACFFFDKTEGNRRMTLRFFTTLCRGLTDCLPAVKPAVCETISNNPNIGNQSLSTQWQDLILNPLAKLDKQSLVPLTLIMVIDALDECEDENDVDTIIQLLSQPQMFSTISLKLFITSRPENTIQSSFNRIPETIFERFPLGKIENSDEESDDDITKLLKHELAIIAHKKELPDDWPGKEEIQILSSKSNGLFIYAATVCRFLGGSKLKNYQLEIRLKSIFSDRVGTDSPQSSLDEIYMHILKFSVIGDAIDEEKEELFNRFQAVVGAIVNLAEPLSIAHISWLISFDRCDVKDTLEGLQSVVSFGDDESSPIQLLHLSFRDFLLDDTRCLIKGFLISKSQVHASLLQNCLEVLSKTLRRDICGLSDQSICAKDVEPAQVNKRIPGHVQYACLHWIYHLQQASIEPSDDGNVHKFLKVHLLHWLEALSLMGKMPEGMRRVIALSSYLHDLLPTGRVKMRSFAYDVRRFVLKFRGLIEETPLELYTSALLHPPIKRKQWDPLEQVLFTGSSNPQDIALSPDGKLVASSYVKVWELATGTLLQTFDTRNDGRKVEFSSDGKHVIYYPLDPLSGYGIWQLVS
ncbi:hypothetical protein N7493_011535 [Penicillium malachiteum]|uniref:NWD NACHT-NTPase N-terminal domain-containing protein n=1 Tax=Penicillium malachiteum TaxID=1324776 RepID=A0AAD6MQJ7_9EURO|nr:hypothetical protein N7493_011535 [Penicillium malachiteum]